jgi:hypothetical protein
VRESWGGIRTLCERRRAPGRDANPSPPQGGESPSLRSTTGDRFADAARSRTGA